MRGPSGRLVGPGALGVIAIVVAQAAAGQTSVPVVPDTPVTLEGRATASQPPALQVPEFDRLRARVEERWRVVSTRDGLVFVPRTMQGAPLGVEMTRTQILIAGDAQTADQLRARLGADADVLLALSHLDDAMRRALFAGPRATAEEPAPKVAASTGPERAFTRRHATRVRIGSTLVIGDQEYVEEAAVAVGGSVIVDGEVAGDVVAVFGNIRLGPRAVVRGDVTAVAGRIEAHPDARILGGHHEVALAWPTRWESPTGHAAGPFIWPDRAWWAGTALVATSVRLLIVGVLGVVAVLLGGSFYRRTSDQAAATPGQAVLVGLGVELLLGPALLLLCVGLLLSIVGIPLLALLPVVLVAAGGLWLVAYAAVLERVGQRVLGRASRGDAPPVVAFLVGFFLVSVVAWTARVAWWAGGIGFGLAMGIGAAGAVIECLAWSAALGALLLAWLRSPRQASPLVAPPPIDASPQGASVR